MKYDKLFSSLVGVPGIKWLPTELVVRMGAPVPTPMTDDEIRALWGSLERDGMTTPLEITTDGIHARLDVGNHRIVIFSLLKISPVPVTIKRVSDVVQSPGNGVHLGLVLDSATRPLIVSTLAASRLRATK